MPLFQNTAVPNGQMTSNALMHPLVGAAGNYQYPLTSGLLSSLTQPGAVQVIGAASLPLSKIPPYTAPQRLTRALTIRRRPCKWPAILMPGRMLRLLSRPARSSPTR